MCSMKDTFIGHYRILEKIGAGGMARVYLAVHRDVPNLRVILKILTDHQLADRFKQEADKLALVDGHPNICRIRHFFDHGEDLVIAMDYIDGPTIEEKIKRHGPLGYDEAIAIISQVLDVLEFAHERGISHRDIKPNNIMLDAHGSVKVIDFGIAKGETDPSMTAVDAYAGTPQYMAPEQFSSSEGTNYALADIYAVGVSLYEMLCGTLPFEGGDLFALRDAKMFEEPRNPRQFRPDMSKHLEGTIMKALRKEPTERFQSAREMKEFLLSGAARDTERRTPPPTPAPLPRAEPQETRPPRPKKRVVPKILGLAAVIVGLVGIGYFTWPYLAGDDAGADRPVTTEPIEAPAPMVSDAPRLLAPGPGGSIADRESTVLTWSSIEQAERYRVEYGRDSLFGDGTGSTATADTSVAIAERLTPGEWFWRVRAENDNPEPGPFSPVYSFTITGPPDTVVAEASPVVAGELVVEVDRPSTIKIDGVVAERKATRLQESLDPGEYTVTVENARTREGALSERVVIESDQRVTQSFEFTDPEFGRVRVESTPPGAKLLVNGELQDNARTPHTLSLPEGRHVVSAISEQFGNRTMQETITIQPGRSSELTFDFQRGESERLARVLADSVRIVKEQLDEVARGSSAFTDGLHTEQAGHGQYGDDDFDAAIESYRAALQLFGEAGDSRGRVEQVVRDKIEQLRAAYEAGDINAIKQLYPDIPGDEESGWKQFFSGVRDLEVTMDVEQLTTAAASADATVGVRMQFSDRQGKKDQSFRWLIQFEDRGSDWVVVERQSE
ncbi:protein kinase [candidate division GN15 bacterium]|nr:protein kinase [candidate division GN15 bacterium]